VSIRELATTIAEFVGFTGEIVWDTTKPTARGQRLLVERLRGNSVWNPDSLRAGPGKTIRGLGELPERGRRPAPRSTSSGQGICRFGFARWCRMASGSSIG